MLKFKQDDPGKKEKTVIRDMPCGPGHVFGVLTPLGNGEIGFINEIYGRTGYLSEDEMRQMVREIENSCWV